MTDRENEVPDRPPLTNAHARPSPREFESEEHRGTRFEMG